MRKRSTQLLVTLALNLAFFYLAGRWVYHNINVHLVMHDISQINKSSLMILCTLAILLILPYATRMAKLLDSSTGTCFKIIAMGFGFNALLPIRIGDVVKIYCSKKFYNINMTKTAYASVIEKLFDIAMVAMLATLFALNAIQGNMLINLILVVLVAFASIYLVQKYRNLILKIKFIPQHFAEHILNTMDEVLHNGKLTYLITNTVVIWLMTAMIYYIFFSMNLPHGQFTIINTICLIVITTFTMSIPSTPGSLGIYESGIVFYLTTQMHVPADQAVAYALTMHLGCLLPQVLTSFVVVIYEMMRRTDELDIEITENNKAYDTHGQTG